MDKLYQNIIRHMNAGVYDQHQLFDLVYPGSRKHYHTVRRAIHNVKSSVLKVA